MHTYLRVWIGAAVMMLVLAGCGGKGGKAADGAVTKAVAVLTAIDGSGVTGEVTFTKVAGGINIEAHLNGLTPGDHGFHIHQEGDCGDSGKAAGGHFNPAGSSHGAPDAGERHVGDLGNINADDSGHGMVMGMVDGHIAFEGDNNIIGKAVIIHFAADDFNTQPTGNAGARVACGVIEVSKAK